MSTFAEQVREARTRQELSQEALAIAARLSRKTVQNVEAGKPATSETARALRAVLNIRRPEIPGESSLQAALDRIPPATDAATVRKISILYLKFALALAMAFACLLSSFLSAGSVPPGAEPILPLAPGASTILFLTSFAFSCLTMPISREISSLGTIRTQVEVDLEVARTREAFRRSREWGVYDVVR